MHYEQERLSNRHHFYKMQLANATANATALVNFPYLYLTNIDLKSILLSVYVGCLFVESTLDPTCVCFIGSE